MTEYFDGKLLVAPPGMRDWRFQRSVVYLWRHDVSGASGVILNKPLESPRFSEVCQEAEIFNAEGIEPALYYGGPVGGNMVGCLHTLDYRTANTQTAPDEQLGFTLDRQIIKDIAEGHGPDQFIITMGLASWTAGQLENEIAAEAPRQKSESWLVMDLDPNIVWHSHMGQMWNACVNISVAEQSRDYVSRFLKD